MTGQGYVEEGHKLEDGISRSSRHFRMKCYKITVRRNSHSHCARAHVERSYSKHDIVQHCHD